jgi:N-acetylmuramoyl-L-alanine amidase CwlD
MSRYAARIGSAFALIALLFAFAQAPASAAQRVTYIFQGKRIVIGHLISQSGGRAVAIDDPGLQTFLNQIGATVTSQPDSRYVLITTGEPVVISFAIGDTRYDVGPVTENAAFAPFMLDGHAYVPFAELLRALDFAGKASGGENYLQPQLASVDVESDGGTAKLVAHGGMPLDGRVISESPSKLVVAFDGVASSLPQAHTIAGGPVRRIDARTEGTVTNPRAIVTLYLTPGTSHSAAGTDDQRDFTIGFNGAPAGQVIAQAPPAPQPQQTAPQAQPLPQQTAAPEVTETEQPEAAASPQPAMAQVTAVQTQPQDGAVAVHIAVSGNAQYEWHRLRPPDNRFWIDVHDARLAIPAQDESANGPLSAVRVHQQNPTTVRVALSLTDFEVLDVTPDANGVTVTVRSALADAASAIRSGAGSIGSNAAVAALPPPSPGTWKFSPRPEPSAPAYVAPNPRLIVIDPGHGGSDPGSYRGDVVEKNLTLDISKRLKDLLVARGWQVMMTRDTDKDVFAPNDSAHDELQARDDVANNNGARMFVSVHVNAFMNAGPHGATVYYFKPSDLALAQAIDRRIGSELQIKDDGIVKDKLYVVHHANMPATLIETAFISNPDDRALLQSPEWRQKMAEAIADGIADYAGPAPNGRTESGQ